MVDDLESIADKLTVRPGEVLAVIHPKIAHALHDGIKLATIGEPSIMGPEVKPRPFEMKYMVVDRPDDDSFTPVSTDNSGNPTNKYPNRLASEMTYGYFGEIGYVDLVQQRGSPRLIGIVHVPTRLVHLIGLVGGESGLERFYAEFCRESEGDRWKQYRWNLQTHRTEFKPSVLNLLPIQDQQYYWKIERTESDVFMDQRPLTEQIATYQTTVRNFIVGLDNYVWRLRPRGLPTDTITPEMAQERFTAIQRGGINTLHLSEFTK